jgi:hypothetical protein
MIFPFILCLVCICRSLAIVNYRCLHEESWLTSSHKYHYLSCKDGKFRFYGLIEGSKPSEREDEWILSLDSVSDQNSNDLQRITASELSTKKKIRFPLNPQRLAQSLLVSQSQSELDDDIIGYWIDGHRIPKLSKQSSSLPINIPAIRLVIQDDGSRHSPVYGFSLDGYPIYGPYDGSHKTRAVSCWEAQSQHWFYNASCTAIDRHHLNEYNGHEHDELGFHYHLTITNDDELTHDQPQLVYPYIIGPYFYGCVDTSHCQRIASPLRRLSEPCLLDETEGPSYSPTTAPTVQVKRQDSFITTGYILAFVVVGTFTILLLNLGYHIMKSRQRYNLDYHLPMLAPPEVAAEFPSASAEIPMLSTSRHSNISSNSSHSGLSRGMGIIMPTPRHANEEHEESVEVSLEMIQIMSQLEDIHASPPAHSRHGASAAINNHSDDEWRNRDDFALSPRYVEAVVITPTNSPNSQSRRHESRT